MILGDCFEQLKNLKTESIQTVVTSPPYWKLRDYQMPQQFGLENTPQEYVSKLVVIFDEIHRILKSDGTVWLNLGDTYWKKNLVGIPWRVAFALQDSGWYLRQDIIWHKPNPKPESVQNRCTKAHEYLFFLSKSPNYYFDADSIRQPHKRLWNVSNGGNIVDRNHKKNGKIETKNMHPKGYPMLNPKGANKRSVWTISIKPFRGGHFATFPIDLIEPCILAGAPIDGVVLDPFMGSGTVGVACKKHQRDFVGIELNPDYMKIAQSRIRDQK